MKRGKLEIIRDIMKTIQESHNQIKPTPLLRKSNLSSSRFKEYYTELLQKGFIKQTSSKHGNHVAITEKGVRFLEKYNVIVGFIDEFEL